MAHLTLLRDRLSCLVHFKYGDSKKDALYAPGVAQINLKSFCLVTSWLCGHQTNLPWKQLTIPVAPAALAAKKDARGRTFSFSTRDIPSALKGKEIGQQSTGAPTHRVIHPSAVY